MATIVTIDATDNITDSRADLNTNFANLNSDKIETSVLDTDTALAANSDAKIATQKATKAYVDSTVTVSASETVKGSVEEATDAEVTAGTATGATGAKLFVTPAKLLTSQATKLNLFTLFESSTRFASIVNAPGTITFDTTGLLLTNAASNSASGATLALGSTANDILTGSPTFTAVVTLTTVGSTGSSFFGVGLVTKDGNGHTYTTDHFGFKVLFSGSVATLYATQGDGSTETASSALTTLIATDVVFLIAKKTSSTSISYYWSKNSGALSSATTLTTNMPDTASNRLQFSSSTDNTASANVFSVNSASYSR